MGDVEMKFIELFAGIGGFRLGLEKAGHQCVWSNEIVDKARSIYEYNFKDKPDPRDIRTIQPDEIPECELLVGGFPCATFSVAGRRTGFSTNDTRGTLFFEICRILSSKRIPYLFLENVKGLLNHDNGRTFGIILASLDELGYDIQWECLNSKNFGIPQNRERVFIVGNLRNKTRPKVFPIGHIIAENDGEKQQQIEIDAGNRNKQSNGIVRQWRRNYFREIKGNYTPTLTANMGTGGNNVPFVEVKAVLTPHRKEKRQNGRRIKNHNEPAFTVTAQDRHGVLVGTQLRKLTPLECERLQSLPDNWTKWYADGKLVTDSQRYERCGRAVTVNVIYEIAKRLPL
jgi:DNA (cytosine-5)-methyltransferase 1